MKKTFHTLAIILLYASTAGLAQNLREDQDDPGAREELESTMLRSPRTGTIPAAIRSRELDFSRTIPARDENKGTKLLAGTWTPRGPFTIGGRTRAFAIDINDENNFLAGGVTGGMWRSIDAGKSWVRTTRLDQLSSVTCIAQDQRPGRTNIWYYGTGERRSVSHSAARSDVGRFLGDGIFKSTNNGLTWEQIPSTVSGSPQTFNPMDAVWRIVCDPSRMDLDVVYAAAVGGIYRSVNAGDSWQLVLGEDKGPDLSFASEVAIDRDGVVYATLSDTTISGKSARVKGFFRSTDGINWTNITPPEFALDRSFRTVMAIDPSDQGRVYFLASTPGSGFRSEMSNDPGQGTQLFRYRYLGGNGAGAGASWENLTDILPDATENYGHYDPQNSYNMAIRVHPEDPMTIVISGTNIYLTENGFASPPRLIGGYNPNPDSDPIPWRAMSYPNHHPDIHDIVFLPSNPDLLFTAGDGGIHRTANYRSWQTEWTPLNNGYMTTQFYAIAINQKVAGDQTIIGGLQDNNSYGSPAPQSPWHWLAGGDGSYCAVSSGNSGFYVSSQYGNIYFSRVNKDFEVDSLRYIWEPAYPKNPLFVTPFVLDPNNDRVLYKPHRKAIWRLEDESAYSWTLEEQLDTLNPEFISNLAVSGDSRDLFYGTSTGRLVRIKNFREDGRNTLDISGTNFPPGAYLQCIAVDPRDSRKILAVFSNYEVPSLFYTTDGGQEWADISGNLEENPDGSGAGPSCRWAEILHRGKTTIFLIGTSTGLYSTTKPEWELTRWQQEGANSIGNVIVPMLRVRQNDGFVAVATHGNGTFAATLQETTDAGGDEADPATFYLEQNSPNPCAGSTQISFTAAQAGRVRIALYDPAGRLMKNFTDEAVAPGYYRKQLNTEGIASGVYFLRMEAGEFAQTRVMTIAR